MAPLDEKHDQGQADAAEPGEPTASSPTKLRRRRVLWKIVAVLLLAWLAAAYFVVPLLWRVYAHRHPALDDMPGITFTANDIPGDPLNVALVGSEDKLIKVLLAAKWHPADPLTLRSSLKIGAASILERPYDDAPVSNLYLFGRKEDLAFEQEVGHDPRHRHHVRFWKSEKVDADGRPAWFGSVTYDKGVGLSHTTGQITHHIDGNVDGERDRLVQQLEQTGDLSETYPVDDFHKSREGRNGGGDPWHTDGKLTVAVIGN